MLHNFSIVQRVAHFFDKCINLQHVVVPPSVISFPKDDDVGVYNPFK